LASSLLMWLKPFMRTIQRTFHLLGLVLSTIETYQGDQIAMACVTEEMFRKTNTNREFSDGFVEEIKEMRGLEVACLLVKWDHRSTR